MDETAVRLTFYIRKGSNAMIIRPYQGIHPTLAPTVRIAENAAVIGSVTCEANVSIWYAATLRGDEAPITVGENTNIQDGAVLHCDGGKPLTLGRNVTIGHGAIIHSCTVGDDSLIGMGATVLSGAVIGKNCIIGAGSLVTGGTVLPDGTLALGVPAKAVRPVKERELASKQHNWKEYVALAQESLDAVGE